MTTNTASDPRPLLMTVPYDGHEAAVRCPGCPHTDHEEEAQK